MLLRLVLGVSVVGSFAAWSSSPKEAVPRSMLQIYRIPPCLLSESRGDHFGDTEAEFKVFLRTQQTLIVCPPVIESALRLPNPDKPGTKIGQVPMLREQADPISWLQGKLQVESDGEIMTLAMPGDGNPEDRKVIVNAVTDAYIDKVVNREQDGRKERVAKLTIIHEGDINQLQAQRLRLRNLTENVGSDDPKTMTLKQQFELARLSEVEKEIMKTEFELMRAQAEQAKPQDTDNRVASLTKYIKGLMAYRDKLEKANQLFYRPSYEVQALRDEIESGKLATARLRKEIDSLTVELSAPPRVQLLAGAVAVH